MTTFTGNLTEFASKFINHTNRHLFLTGRAGTGKTTFLKHIVKHTHKNVIVAAPTGIAAINAGGVTLHSLFQLPFGYFIPENNAANHFDENQQVNTPNSLLKNAKLNKNKIKLIRELELLIIDEVSMLRADLLDAIDTLLRSVKRKSYVPFGGVQLLLIGDLMQLPPVIRDNEWNVLKNYYASIYFFNAKAFDSQPPIQIELDKIYRQADEKFIQLLNNIRDNKVTPQDFEVLKSHYQPNFKPLANEGYIRLTTHNKQADSLNNEELQKIKTKSYYFDAEIEGDFSEYNYPISQRMELKKGAQVMFIKNDPTGRQQFFNGKIGVISEIDNEGIVVKSHEDNSYIDVEKYMWENVKYQLNTNTNEIEEKVVGTFTQYPLKLAWAITIHKSQGLTFDKAIIDIGYAFASGQVYVALSRLRSLDGLVMTSELNPESLSIDEQIATFCHSKPNLTTIQQILKTEEKVFFQNYLIESYNFSSLIQQTAYHLSTYTKEENRSAKQKFADWAKIFYEKVKKLEKPSTTFQKQLQTIISKNNNYQHLFERITAANNYFEPLLKEFSTAIFNHIDEVKKQPKVKKYVTELKELETDVHKHVLQITKAKKLVETAINNKEFSKEVLQPKMQDSKRKEQIKQVEKKAPKVDTKSLSLSLFKEGKTISEIAKERGLTEGTIFNHLAHFAAEKSIDVKEIVPENHIKAISEILKKQPDFNSLTELKNQLDDAITFDEIRLVVKMNAE